MIRVLILLKTAKKKSLKNVIDDVFIYFSIDSSINETLVYKKPMVTHEYQR